MTLISRATVYSRRRDGHSIGRLTKEGAQAVGQNPTQLFKAQARMLGRKGISTRFFAIKKVGKVNLNEERFVLFNGRKIAARASVSISLPVRFGPFQPEKWFQIQVLGSL